MTRRDPILAALGAIAFATAAFVTDRSAVATARLAVLGLALGAIASVDLREHRIPNRLVAPATIVCAALLAVDRIELRAFALAFVLVGALLAASLTMRSAPGMGDVKLAFLIVVGVDGDALAALAGGFALAAVYAVVVLARSGSAARGTAVPLGPFLAVGALLAAVLG